MLSAIPPARPWACSRSCCCNAGMTSATKAWKTPWPTGYPSDEQDDEDGDDENHAQPTGYSVETSYSDDVEARWTKKGKVYCYGYKGHLAVGTGHGFILGGHVTVANRPDCLELMNVVGESGLEDGGPVFADKGYASADNRCDLEDAGWLFRWHHIQRCAQPSPGLGRKGGEPGHRHGARGGGAGLREHEEALWPGTGPLSGDSQGGDAVPALGHGLQPFDRRQIAALAGLAPFDQDSGKFQGRRRIWGGRAAVRAVLYMAVVRAIRFNPVIRDCYQRLTTDW